MRRTYTLIILLSLSGCAVDPSNYPVHYSSVYPCSKIEYAELQDMSTSEQIAYFCKVQDLADKNFKSNGEWNQVTAMNNAQQEQQNKMMLSTQDAFNECKAAAESVVRLLRRKNVTVAPDCHDR